MEPASKSGLPGSSRSGLFVDELLGAIVTMLKARPDLVDALRSVFGPVSAAKSPEKVFMSVREYAVHIGYSKRTVENLIGHGLPLTGTGRLRRVPVSEADAWLRQGRASDVVERRARLNARRHAMTVLARPRGPTEAK